MPTPRDLTLSASDPHISESIASTERAALARIEQAEREPDNPHQYSLLYVPRDLAHNLLERYARGDGLDDLRRYFLEWHIPLLQRATAAAAPVFPDYQLRSHFERWGAWMMLFYLACFDSDGSLLREPERWYTMETNPPLLPLVLKGLIPGYEYPGTYNASSSVLAGDEQLVTILLQPPESWPQACAALMRSWPKLMKPFGYREQVQEGKIRCPAFANNLALVVCAYDIDDSSFRHLPYYPHDLVDYYRSHVRQQRDGWRTAPPDPAAGLPASARPQPKKVYARSKGEAYARWVELVGGERPELVERARKALGKRKTMPELDRATEPLAAAGLALHADIKDDATLAAQAQALCQSWQLPWPQAPASDLAGPARITVLLDTLNQLDADPGPRLAVLDDESDTWHAVLYPSEHGAELCEQLGIGRMTPEQWQ